MTTYGRESARAARLHSTDARAHATQRLLVEALTNVVETEGFEEATATRIAREAGLSRSGFYEHFANVDELSLFVLDNLLAETTALDLQARRATGSQDHLSMPESAVQTLVEAIQQRRDLYEHLLLSDRAAGAVGRAMERFTQSAQAVVEVVRPELPAAQQELHAAAIGGAILGIIINYLRTADARPASELANDIIAVMPDWMYSAHPSGSEAVETP